MESWTETSNQPLKFKIKKDGLFPVKKGCIISRLVLGVLTPRKGRTEGRNREVEREEKGG